MSAIEFREWQLDRDKIELADKQRAHQFTMARETEFLKLDAMVKRGELTPHCRDLLRTHYAGQFLKFSARGELTMSQELAGQVARLNASLPKGETATDAVPLEHAGRPDEQLAGAAERLLGQNPRLSYSDAVQTVFAANPELKFQYHRSLPNGR